MNLHLPLLPLVLGMALAPTSLAQRTNAGPDNSDPRGAGLVGPGVAGPSVAGPASQDRSAGNRYGLPSWFADYPVALQLPHSSAKALYQRSRRQAIEKVVANLQGNVSKDAWHMAMEFFSRAPADALEPLTEAMDRAFGKPAFKDFVKHTIEAMGQLGVEEADEALLRALEHPDQVVRGAVFSALAGAGSKETIRRTFPIFMSGMDGRGRKSWLRAARLRLGKDAVPMFQQIMSPSMPPAVRDLVVVEAVEMAPEHAALVFEEMWEVAEGNFKTVIAGVFHADGRASGAAHLRSAMRDPDPKVVVHALNNLAHKGPLGLLDDVLQLIEHPSHDVRLQVARLLATVPGEASTNALERLTAPDQALEVQMAALRELSKRGRDEAVGLLLEEVRTLTGTRLQYKLRVLGASGDARIVPLFAERVRSSPPEEGREFLQSLAFSGAPGAAEALVELFLEEPRLVSDSERNGGALSTLNYIPVLLPNLRGSELALVQAWDRIPAEDHVRRALYLQALVSIAADRDEPGIREPIAKLLRRLLFDSTALPQLRIQALNSLTRKFLTLSDVMRLKRLQEPLGDRESRQMRALLKDFLFEYF